MKNKTTVSIIVPVYNVEQYLSRCIESIINQTFQDIEVILINDGSTDNSLKILKKYEERDSRIILIDKENEGISQTRNLGIEKSKGEYIVFVDSDDWLELDFIELLYEKAIQMDCDLVMSAYTRNYPNRELRKKISLKSNYLFNNQETKEIVLRKLIGPIKEELAQPENLDSLVTVWGKLYKTSVIKDNHIKFKDIQLIGTAEDLLFNVEVFLHLKNSYFIDLPLYHYWKDNSKSFTSHYKKNLYQKWKNRDEKIIQLLMDSGNMDFFQEAINNRVCLSMIGLGLNEISPENKISTLGKIKNINHILKDMRMREAYKQLKFQYLPIKWKLFCFFNRYCLGILSYLMLQVMQFLRKYI